MHSGLDKKIPNLYANSHMQGIYMQIGNLFSILLPLSWNYLQHDNESFELH